jgi:ABC-2 type transport system permease protein
VTNDSAVGEVFDLGYRPYEGTHEGRVQAIRAIWRDSIRASLGLGRSVSSKLLPIGIIGLAFAPAVIMTVIIGFVASFGGDVEEFGLPTNSEYYKGLALVPVMLFAAAISPEMLCPDRRSGVLALYFVRPLTPLDYVAARWLGFFSVSLAILWLPQLLLFATRAFTAESPFDWLRDHPWLLLQIAGSGFSMAALLTSIGMAVSSFTDRRPYAAATALGLLIGSIAVGAIASEVTTGTTSDWLRLLSVVESFLRVNDLIFRLGGGALSSVVYVGHLVAIVLLGWVALWWRYRGVAS